MKRIILILSLVLVAVFVIGSLLKMGKGKEPKPVAKTATVEKGDILVAVVDSGTLDAAKVVELKSRASGRLKRLYRDEGDVVRIGELLAEIDPQETQLKVDQDSAQLRGAQSSVGRSSIEIAQRRIAARANFEQSKARLAQLELELKAQPTLTSSAVTQASSALAAARQERDRLRTSIHPNARTAASTALREAEANFANAQKEYERQLDLLEKGYVAARTVENAKLSLDLARARLDSARANFDRTDGQLALEMSKSDEDVRRAEAEYKRAMANRIQDGIKREEYLSAIQDVEKARAALQDVDVLIKSREQALATVSQLQSVVGDSQRQLRETKIFSPISGIVTKKFVQEGELVAALSGFSSGTSILRIEDRSAMLVKLNLNEIDVAKLTKGMEAKITVDAFPEASFTGIVSKIAPASNNLTAAAIGQSSQADAVVKYLVEIRLSTPDPRLRSGMSAKCSLNVINKKGVLRLPVEFIGKDAEGQFVMLAPEAQGAKSVRKKVTVGATSGSMIEIVSGLVSGQVVAKPEYKGPDRKGFMEGGMRD